MVRLNRIYTRGGDAGETALGSGQRVAKNDPRIEAIGAVDEANAALGLARLETSGTPDLDALLGRVQNDLFDLGADLCLPEDGARAGGALRITEGQVSRLETEIDSFNAALAPLDSFVLPGGSRVAAQLHMARVLVRRAERAMVALAAIAPVTPAALRYINRLSDLLFVLARHSNDRGRADVLWRPGGTR